MKKAHENIEQLDGNTSLRLVSTTDEPSTETETFTLKYQESQTKIGPMLIKGPGLQQYIDNQCPELYPGWDFWTLS